MTSIITDKTKLSAHIKRALSTYAKVGDAIHVAVVSALHHAAKYGDPQYLTAIYSGLRSNDQTAMKMYLRRVSAIVGLEGENPDGQESEVVIAAVAAGGIVTLEKGEFVITQGHTSVAAKSTVALCESRLIKPDGKVDRKVLDRNNFAEVKTLGDAEVLDRILKLVADLNKESDTKKVSVSDPVRKLVEDFGAKAQSYKNQNSLAA